MMAWTDFPIGNHRVVCPCCGRKSNDKTMGVTVAGDEHGVAHCFRCGHIETRQSDRLQTPEERRAFARRMDALRRQHEAEQRQRQAEAAAADAIRWAGALPALTFPYLTTKTVKAHGLRIESWQTALVPMRDTEGQLHCLQAIKADGSKRFTKGGRVKGLYHAIGRPSGRLVICEGYATGATIYEQTGAAVAVAFNAGNLLPVAKALRSKFPCLTLVIAADDDWKTEGNPGVTAATEAARAVGGLLAIPNFVGLPRGDNDSDFNQ